MARARDKDELLRQARENYEAFNKLVDGMSQKQMDTPFDFSANPKLTEAHWSRDKNVRDLFIHLYEWQELMLAFVKNNLNGKTSTGKNMAFLPSEYSWKTYGAMNVAFWNKHQSTSLEDARNKLAATHEEVVKLIESFSNEELFTKKYFDFTGTTDLGSYFVSSTASHYDWAIKKVKLHCKSVGE